MAPPSVNINCDLGEGVAQEPQIYPYIYSCSIACGGHYGDSTTLLSTLTQAKEHQVKVGAHPSYPDKENFGRQTLSLSKEAFQQSMHDQLQLYFRCLFELDMDNHHVKAHGALYNDLAKSEELSAWYVEVLQNYSFGCLYAPHGSALATVALNHGMEVQYEAFLDRNYTAEGALVTRSQPNALKQDPLEVWQQLLGFLERGGVFTAEGTWLPLPASTFCLHGDHPKVLEFLTTIEKGLKQLGL